MSLLKLPTELLQQIFSHAELRQIDICNIAFTCRQLYDVSLKLLYRSLDIYPTHNGPRSAMIEHIDQYFSRHPDHLPWVHNVSAAWFRRTDEPTAMLFNLLPRLSSMRELQLIALTRWSNSYIPCFIQFTEKARGLNSLRRLDIEDSRLSTQDIVALYAIPNLETLIIRSFSKDPGFVELEEYPPTKLTRLEFPDSTSLPTGPCVEFLLQGHPMLRSLVWTCQPRQYPEQWSPEDVQRALRLLSASLVKLRLILANSLGIQDLTLLDFSDFNKLESLDFHEILPLDRTFFIHQAAFAPPIPRDGLPGRLPASLEKLKISYDPGAYALDQATVAPMHQWILALAYHKLAVSTSLSSVEILETNNWAKVPKWRRSDPGEWECGSEVEALFQDAGIQLKVMIRSSHVNEAVRQ